MFRVESRERDEMLKKRAPLTSMNRGWRSWLIWIPSRKFPVAFFFLTWKPWQIELLRYATGDKGPSTSPMIFGLWLDYFVSWGPANHPLCKSYISVCIDCKTDPLEPEQPQQAKTAFAPYFDDAKLICQSLPPPYLPPQLMRLLSTLLMVVTMRMHWSGLRHRPHGTAVAVLTSFLQIAAVWELLGGR